MPKEYDVHDVNIYITAVMKRPPLERVQLWLALQEAPNEESVDSLIVRFQRHGLATQANILFRFGPIIDKVVRQVAKAKSDGARRTGAM